jgi:two-component system secretion sensor histidine kinase SsrA
MLDSETPIFALTANALPSEHARIKAFGMHGYLTKPIALEQLMSVVESVVMMQFDRGIELKANPSLQKPLLDLDDTETREQFYAELVALQQRIDDAWRRNARDQMLDLLHAIKGCAGQGGAGLVREVAEQQELQIQEGSWPSQQDISDLGRLICQLKSKDNASSLLENILI